MGGSKALRGDLFYSISIADIIRYMDVQRACWGGRPGPHFSYMNVSKVVRGDLLYSGRRTVSVIWMSKLHNGCACAVERAIKLDL